MARIAIRATGDSSNRQKVITAQARVVLVVERDGKDYATLAIYRKEDGGLAVTVDGGKVPQVEQDATRTRYVVYL